MWSLKTWLKTNTPSKNLSTLEFYVFGHIRFLTKHPFAEDDLMKSLPENAFSFLWSFVQRPIYVKELETMITIICGPNLLVRSHERVLTGYKIHLANLVHIFVIVSNSFTWHGSLYEVPIGNRILWAKHLCGAVNFHLCCPKSDSIIRRQQSEPVRDFLHVLHFLRMHASLVKLNISPIRFDLCLPSTTVIKDASKSLHNAWLWIDFLSMYVQ